MLAFGPQQVNAREGGQYDKRPIALQVAFRYHVRLLFGS